MFRKFVANVKPHIIPELIRLFKIMIPCAMLFSLVFAETNAQDVIKPWPRLFLFGTLYSLVGIILMRIVAHFVKKVLTGIPVVRDDIYQDPEKLKQA